MKPNRFRYLSWVQPNTRPWILGRRPIKNSTFRLLIKKGYFPYTGKTANVDYWGNSKLVYLESKSK